MRQDNPRRPSYSHISEKLDKEQKDEKLQVENEAEIQSIISLLKNCNIIWEAGVTTEEEYDEFILVSKNLDPEDNVKGLTNYLKQSFSVEHPQIFIESNKGPEIIIYFPQGFTESNAVKIQDAVNAAVEPPVLTSAPPSHLPSSPPQISSDAPKPTCTFL